MIKRFLSKIRYLLGSEKYALHQKIMSQVDILALHSRGEQYTLDFYARDISSFSEEKGAAVLKRSVPQLNVCASDLLGSWVGIEDPLHYEDISTISKDLSRVLVQIANIANAIEVPLSDIAKMGYQELQIINQDNNE